MMKKMERPKIEVIRFNENDVIVASSGLRGAPTITMSRFSGGTPKDGTVQYNGNSYSIASKDDVSTFLSALRNNGIRNAGISNGASTQSLRNTLGYEVSDGARNWDGTFVYDSSAKWNNGDVDLFGVFIRQ